MSVHFETNEWAVVVFFIRGFFSCELGIIFGNLNMSRAENIEYIQDCTTNAMRHIERRNFEWPIVAQW